MNRSGKLDEHCVIGSLDVKALYPSLDVPFVAEKVAEMFLDSNLTVPSLDVKELGLYLALNRKPAELEAKDILQFCPRRKTTDGRVRGRPPVITGCATSEQEEKRVKPWDEAQNTDPGPEDQKRMLAEAIAIVVEVVMTNHVYIFNGIPRKQSKGGPIGLALTGDVAQVFMCWWDRELIRKAEEESMEMLLYKRFVDDINTITRKITPEIVGENPIVPDQDRMKQIQEMADGIHTSIKTTVDCPSRHDDNKLTILDLKAWLETQAQDGTQAGNRTFVLHEFYHKEVASRAVIHARSAVPTHTKRTILTQEVIRILKNCSKRLPWKDVCSHVETFCSRMQFSGHSITMRAQVVRSAMTAYKRAREKDEEGVEPMHRTRDWKKGERMRTKRKKKSNWFRGKGGKKESVIFIPATPGSVLKKRYEKVIDQAKMEIAVVEKPGDTLKKRLQRSDPFRRKFCDKKEKCMVCSGEGGGRCRDESVTYVVLCSECEARYIGETARNGHTRGIEHRSALRKRDLNSPLYSHCIDRHDGRQVPFHMQVTGTFGGDALKRQIKESVLIMNEPAQRLLNRRDEWRHTTLPRVAVCRD